MLRRTRWSAAGAVGVALTLCWAAADPALAQRRVIGRPGVFLNTAGDIQLLPKILDAASRYEKRPHDDAMAAMLEKQYMTTLFGLGPQAIR